MSKDVSNIDVRILKNCQWYSPKKVLVELRKLEEKLISNPIVDQRTLSLRTNETSFLREIRDAAIFCVGVEERYKLEVKFTPTEREDYDFVMSHEDGKQKKTALFKVQLKELPPPELNMKAKLDDILNKLKRYKGSQDLIVAIKLSRAADILNLNQEILNSLEILELWFFWCVSPNSQSWMLYGSVLSGSLQTKFEYPLE